MIGSGIRARDHRLQCHAADWARAGSDLTDFRVHGTCVDRPLINGGGFLRVCLPKVLHRIGHEFLAASIRAEVIRVSVMRRTVLGGVRIDIHAADRVLHLSACRRMASMRMMIVRAVLA